MIRELAQALHELAMTGRMSDESSNAVGYVLSGEYSDVTGDPTFDEELRKQIREFVDSELTDFGKSLRNAIDEIESQTQVALDRIEKESSVSLQEIKEYAETQFGKLKDGNESYGHVLSDVQQRVTRLESLKERVSAVEKKQAQRQTPTAKKN